MQRAPVFLGVDVGTSACKTVALSASGRVLATATRSYPTRYAADGEATQDPEDWLRAVRATVRDCRAALDGRRVEALGVTAPAHCAVLVDRKGEPLARALLAVDARPDPVVAELRARLGESFTDLTWERLTGSWTFPQLVWLRRVAPELWPRLRQVLVVKDFVRYRLTGRTATDPTDAAGTGLYDQQRRAWSPLLVGEAALSLDHLPQVLPCLETGGAVGVEWARLLGIPRGTPVAVGATDTAAELVSVGAVSAGDAIVKIASTATVVAVSRDPRPHPALLTYPHVLPDRWYTAAATNTAATALSWLIGLVGPKVARDEARRALLLREAARAPAASRGVIFLPFLAGERTPYWDANLRAAFLGLSASCGRAEMSRAVLEGVAFALRSCRDLMRENGLPIARPYLTGGGNAIPLWRSILVAVLGVEGQLATPQGPAIGAALMAGAARAGAAVLPAVRRRVRTVAPRTDWLAPYDRHYAVYRAAADQALALSRELTVATSRAGVAGDIQV